MFKCFFGHKWITLLLEVGYRKPHRKERKCKKCHRREIALDQFTERVRKQIREKFGEEEDWYYYTKNNWLDLYTRYVLTGKLEE